MLAHNISKSNCISNNIVTSSPQEKKTMVPFIISILILFLGILLTSFGIWLASPILITLGSIITLVIAIVITSIVIINLLKNQKLPPILKKEQSSQTFENQITVTTSTTNNTSLNLLEKKEHKESIAKKLTTTSESRLEANKNLNPIRLKIEKIFLRNWRIGLDKNSNPRYVCIQTPIGLFLSIRKGSLLSSHSTLTIPFSTVVDITDPNMQERNQLLSLIPFKHLEKSLLQVITINLEDTSPKKSDSFLSHLICVKGLHDFLDKLKDIQEQNQKEFLFNILKTLYTNIFKEAVLANVRILQLVPLHASFPDIKATEEEDFSKLALLEAFQKYSQSNKFMGSLQEIIIISKTAPNF